MRNSLTIKVFFTGFLVLLLLIPSAMVQEVIQERSDTLQQAQRELADKWGQAQTVGGPILSIPYLRSGVRYTAYFLPESLAINGGAKSQIRQRGSFEVSLYTTDLTLDGTFATPNFAALDIPSSSVLWSDASLLIGITDLKGLRDFPVSKWNKAPLSFQPSIQKEVFASGIQARLLGQNVRMPSSFSIALSLNGSESLHFLPLGRETLAHLSSDWKTPSFNGAFLPNERTIESTGFTSDWKILELNRNLPQSWKDEGNLERPFLNLFQFDYKNGAEDGAFGLDFLFPVDIYQKSERSVKYAGLFIVLTFLTYFLLEVFLRLRIHPIQYLLVGFSLVLFFLMLLSIAEQTSFGIAYLISSVATVGLVTSYSAAILRKKAMSLWLFAILSLQYAYLFILLHREDYSLLIGTLGLFLILSLVMFLTRKIDWYNASAEG